MTKEPRYDVPNQAPEPLRLVQRFVNTVDLQHGVEWLPDAAALERWLCDHELAIARTPTRAEWRRALELREALRKLLLVNNGFPLDRKAREIVNRRSRAARLTFGVGAGGEPAILPTASGIDAALGAILAVVYRAMLAGTWLRLKACRNDVCRWSFYDYSKNRSGSWCSMSICGNRVKTRRYRARRRALPRR